jgi:hypothetical protein
LEAGTPLNGKPPLITGSKPLDGGFMVLDTNERAQILLTEPDTELVLRPYQGAHEYLNGYTRYVISLQDVAPQLLRTLTKVRQRLEQVRNWRLTSKSRTTLDLADQPSRWHITVIPDAPFLVVPNTSSERRDYVPIGWIEPPVVPNQKLRVLADATVWDFAILTSGMHMAWLRHIGGRMKSDYSYSSGLVYNTFPWPDATPAQRAKIEALAQDVLDARALPKNATSTLADLYDPDRMPAELYKAHKALDAAVDRLYAPKGFSDDRARVEHLFRRYEALVMPTAAAAAANRRTNRRVARAGK